MYHALKIKTVKGISIPKERLYRLNNKLNNTPKIKL